jgi:hypothetical protein
MIAASSSGVVPVGSIPRPMSFSLVAVPRSDFAIAADSRSIAGFGVRAGA